jgi:hypothetical protein
MKHQLRGLLRSGHPTRVEEWHDPEPGADDDPPVVSTGPARAEADVLDESSLRFEFARHLARTSFPAKRAALVRTLHEQHAPDQLIDLVRRLPEDNTRYGNVRELASAVVNIGIGA